MDVFGQVLGEFPILYLSIRLPRCPARSGWEKGGLEDCHKNMQLIISVIKEEEALFVPHLELHES